MTSYFWCHYYILSTALCGHRCQCRRHSIHRARKYIRCSVGLSSPVHKLNQHFCFIGQRCSNVQTRVEQSHDSSHGFHKQRCGWPVCRRSAQTSHMCFLSTGAVLEGDGSREHRRQPRRERRPCDHRPGGQWHGHHPLEPDAGHAEEACVHVAPITQDISPRKFWSSQATRPKSSQALSLHKPKSSEAPSLHKPQVITNLTSSEAPCLHKPQVFKSPKSSEVPCPCKPKVFTTPKPSQTSNPTNLNGPVVFTVLMKQAILMWLLSPLLNLLLGLVL